MTPLDCTKHREEIRNRFLCGKPFSAEAREHYINCVDCIANITGELSKNCNGKASANGHKPISEAAKAAIARGRRVLERELGIPADL